MTAEELDIGGEGTDSFDIGESREAMHCIEVIGLASGDNSILAMDFGVSEGPTVVGSFSQNCCTDPDLIEFPSI